MIDPRLHVLRMLAAHGTVTATAKALHYTPSAISHQLRGLAEELGVPLLTRHGREVRLTPAARTLLGHADELYARWEEIRALVAADGSEDVGMLRLCGFSTAAAALLPAVARRLQRARPSLQVRIIEADPLECFELLLADDADLAVVVAVPSLPASIDARFDQEHLLEDPLDLLVPVDHALASRSSVALSETADEPWIVYRPGRPHRQLVFTSCAEAGFTPSIAHEAAEWDTGAALVAAGFGVCLVPRLARLPAGYDICRIPLRGDPTPSRHILTSVRRGSRGRPIIAEALDALAVSARSAGRLSSSAPSRGAVPLEQRDRVPNRRAGPAAVPGVVVGQSEPVPAAPALRGGLGLGAACREHLVSSGTVNPPGGPAGQVVLRQPALGVQLRRQLPRPATELDLAPHQPAGDEREHQQRGPERGADQRAGGDQGNALGPYQQGVEDQHHHQHPDGDLGAHQVTPGPGP